MTCQIKHKCHAAGDWIRSPAPNPDAFEIRALNGVPDKARTWPGENVIVVDAGLWRVATPAQRAMLIAHEMAHHGKAGRCEDCADRRAGAIMRQWGFSEAATARAFASLIRSRPQAGASAADGWRGIDAAAKGEHYSFFGERVFAAACRMIPEDVRRKANILDKEPWRTLAKVLPQGACEVTANLNAIGAAILAGPAAPLVFSAAPIASQMICLAITQPPRIATRAIQNCSLTEAIQKEACEALQLMNKTDRGTTIGKTARALMNTAGAGVIVKAMDLLWNPARAILSRICDGELPRVSDLLAFGSQAAIAASVMGGDATPEAIRRHAQNIAAAERAMARAEKQESAAERQARGRGGKTSRDPQTSDQKRRRRRSRGRGKTLMNTVSKVPQGRVLLPPKLPQEMEREKAEAEKKEELKKIGAGAIVAGAVILS